MDADIFRAGVFSPYVDFEVMMGASTESFQPAKTHSRLFSDLLNIILSLTSQGGRSVFKGVGRDILHPGTPFSPKGRIDTNKNLDPDIEYPFLMVCSMARAGLKD